MIKNLMLVLRFCPLLFFGCHGLSTKQNMPRGTYKFVYQSSCAANGVNNYTWVKLSRIHGEGVVYDISKDSIVKIGEVIGILNGLTDGVVLKEVNNNIYQKLKKPPQHYLDFLLVGIYELSDTQFVHPIAGYYTVLYYSAAKNSLLYVTQYGINIVFLQLLTGCKNTVNPIIPLQDYFKIFEPPPFDEKIEVDTTISVQH